MKTWFMSNLEKQYLFKFPWLRFYSFLILFSSVFTDLVNEALINDENTKIQSPVLNQILTAEGVDIRDKIVAIIDLVAAGIETVLMFART